ncbi:MAG: hypothetical protein AB1515_03025 [Nitrospirota bacterium]
MKIALIGGGEQGLHLLSWLSADASTRIPLVVEPDRQALIYRVEAMGFRWGETVSGGRPPLLSASPEAIADVAELDLLVASTADEALLAQVRRAAPAGVPLLSLDDLGLCDALRHAVNGSDQMPDTHNVSRERVTELLERLAHRASWAALLERITWLMQLVCAAPTGALFIYRGWGRRLLLEHERGAAPSGPGQRLLYRGAAQRAIEEQRTVRMSDADPAGMEWETLALPLLLDERPVGALVLARRAHGARLDSHGSFALAWLAIPLAGLLSRGMQMEWTRESAVRDQIRRGIKEIIGRNLPAAEACRLGLEVIADRLAAPSCRLYCRGPRAAGWLAAAEAPDAPAGAEPSAWRDAAALTAASLEPLWLIREEDDSAGSGRRLYLPFSLGAQGDGVMVIQHHAAETWSAQLVELLKEMAQLLGSMAQRVSRREDYL